MRKSSFLISAALLLGACAGDQHLTKQSPSQPARIVAGNERKDGAKTIFARNRIYQITRLETADQRRGEWRALGETIHESGSSIEFTELGSGKTVSFTAPHQITATSSVGDRPGSQFSTGTNAGASSAPVDSN
jgi:hypothetical protein